MAWNPNTITDQLGNKIGVQRGKRGLTWIHAWNKAGEPTASLALDAHDVTNLQAMIEEARSA